MLQTWTPPSDISLVFLNLHLYSLTFAAGLLAGYFISREAARRLRIDLQTFDTVILSAIICGLLGARLFFAAGHWPEFANEPLQVLAFWQGGLSIYGALIGGIAAIVFWTLYKKINLFLFLDSVAPGLALGQAIGRLGNFFNQEAYGNPTNLPWKIYIEPDFRLPGYESYSFFHPTFLYEFLILISLFIVLWYLVRSSKFNNFRLAGIVFAVYAIVAGAARYFIEFLRIDALQLNGVLISQLAALLLAVFGIILLIYRIYDNQKQNS